MSKRKQISQREAHALKKRVAELEYVQDMQRISWAREYVGGTHVSSVLVDEGVYAAVLTARRLDHAVVVTCPNRGRLMLHALPLSRYAK